MKSHPASTGAAPSPRVGRPLASFAGFYPAAFALVHALCLASSARFPGLLRPIVPFSVEVALFWLPFASVCLGAPAVLPAAQRSLGRVLGLLGLAASVAYAALLRAPLTSLPERFIETLLFREISSTWSGFPAVALGLWIGLTSFCALIALLGRALAKQEDSRLALIAAQVFAGLLFVVGSSVLLRYATGSPWPLVG